MMLSPINMPEANVITVQAHVNLPTEKVWTYWTEPEHVMQWNSASDDWHTPKATNDLREGGTFTSRMEAKDGSAGFDFTGTYTKVEPHARIEYTMEDGRNVTITFREENGGTTVTETFDAETQNPVEMQREGWQAILENFKRYAEERG